MGLGTCDPWSPSRARSFSLARGAPAPLLSGVWLATVYSDHCVSNRIWTRSRSSYLVASPALTVSSSSNGTSCPPGTCQGPQGPHSLPLSGSGSTFQGSRRFRLVIVFISKVVSISALGWSPLIVFTFPVSVFTMFAVSLSRCVGKNVNISFSFDWVSFFVPVQ